MILARTYNCNSNIFLKKCIFILMTFWCHPNIKLCDSKYWILSNKASQIKTDISTAYENIERDCIQNSIKLIKYFSSGSITGTYQERALEFSAFQCSLSYLTHGRSKSIAYAIHELFETFVLLRTGSMKLRKSYHRLPSRWHNKKNSGARGWQESRKARGGATTRTDCFEQDSWRRVETPHHPPSAINPHFACTPFCIFHPSYSQSFYIIYILLDASY